MNSNPVRAAAVSVCPAATGVPFDKVTMPLAGSAMRVTIRLPAATAGSSGAAMPMAVAPAFSGTVSAGENASGATIAVPCVRFMVSATVPLAVCPAVSRTV